MKQMNRREVMKTGLAAAALGAASNFEWILPAMAQGEVMVPFSDSHQTFNANPAIDRRLFDTRALSGAFTPKDQFFTTQHYGHPEVDAAAYRLKVGGQVNSPKSFSIDEIRKMGTTELIAGFECSGNRRPVQGLIGNGRWTGVPLKTVLDAAGLKPMLTRSCSSAPIAARKRSLFEALISTSNSSTGAACRALARWPPTRRPSSRIH